MGLWNLVSALRQRDQQWTASAEHIAADVLDAMWSRMEVRLSGMKLSEARGYLRARTRGSVVQRVETCDDRQVVRSKMQRHALDELVRLGVSRLLAPQPAPVPIPLRRAA